MRAVLGFLLLHALFIATGLMLLRSLRLSVPRASPVAALCAIGPAFLVGVAAVVPIQIVLLVVGVPLTPAVTALVCLGCSLVAAAFARLRPADRVDPPSDTEPGSSPLVTRLKTAGAIIAFLYLAVGAWAFARLRTTGDDARIWSLRGLTLAYTHGLQPEIFQNPGQAGAHPVYPLFQPALEALLFQSMGSAQLRFFHTELWLIAGAAIWTAAYLIAGRTARSIVAKPIWISALALLAVTPAVLVNVYVGYADVTASLLLAVGVLSLGLWLDGNQLGHLGMAAILLAAAANTKDEDLLATLLVLLCAGIIVVLQRRGRPMRAWLRQGLIPFGVAVLYVAILVAPWQLWTRAHHLSDSVQPPLPRALQPSYILSRSHELHLTATAMLTQALNEFGWLAAIFIVACAVCLLTGTARRTVCFYLASFISVVISLLWLYTTTPLPLSFLLPTSMNRTVDVFMVLSAMATAHLIARLGDNRLHRHVPEIRTRIRSSHGAEDDR